MFTALAYPEPEPSDYTWYKKRDESWTPLLSNTDLQISSAGIQTNLTIWNVSETDFTKYRVTAENKLGSYDQYLFLVPKGIYLNARITW
jgi:hypothetical protein